MARSHTFIVSYRPANSQRTIRKVNASTVAEAVNVASEWGTVVEVSKVVATTIHTSEFVIL